MSNENWGNPDTSTLKEATTIQPSETMKDAGVQSEGLEENETSNQNRKDYMRDQKRMLKIECLKLAGNTGSANEIVASAQKFYNFVRK